MAAGLFKAPTANYESTSLNGAINDSATTITVNDASNMQSPGYIVIDREDGSGTATPNAREVVKYTGISTNDLTGCTRGSDNSSAASHSDGALVEPVLTVGMWNDQRDNINTEHFVNGTHAPIAAASIATLDTTSTAIGTATITNLTVASTATISRLEAATGTALNNSMARQAIQNGNFDVWQRSTSETDPANDSYTTADRWYHERAYDGGTGPTTRVHSRQQQTPGDLDSSYWFFRLNVNGAGSGFGTDANYRISQKIESGTRYLTDGNTVTVSFYAKSDIADKKIGIYLTQNYGTGGAPDADETINGANWTLTSSWVKYTNTFTTNTLTGKTFGSSNNDYLDLIFQTMWGTDHDDKVGASGAEDFGGSGDIDIAQVQLCAGSVALPFQPKSYESELAACQRYCHVLTSSSAGNHWVSGVGYATSTTNGRVPIPLPTSMRIVPSLTATASDWQIAYGSAAGNLTVLAVVANKGTVSQAMLDGTTTGLTLGDAVVLRGDGSGTRTLILDAEI